MPDFSSIVIATNEQKQHLTKSLMQSIFIFFPFHLHNPIFLSLSPPFSPSVYILCLFSLTESIFNYFSYSYLLDSIPTFFFSLPLLLRQVCLSVHLCFSLYLFLPLLPFLPRPRWTLKARERFKQSKQTAKDYRPYIEVQRGSTCINSQEKNIKNI